jgi:hypothetical protein
VEVVGAVEQGIGSVSIWAMLSRAPAVIEGCEVTVGLLVDVDPGPLFAVASNEVL